MKIAVKALFYSLFTSALVFLYSQMSGGTKINLATKEFELQDSIYVPKSNVAIIKTTSPIRGFSVSNQNHFQVGIFNSRMLTISRLKATNETDTLTLRVGDTQHSYYIQCINDEATLIYTISTPL
ncbi:MAG: hypothetical protein IM631_05065 [Cytophagales bacterium]|nr:hypothetical protein [Cytophagales bacterium]MCA6370751.1 hypothetical protein [Cytophagales bacterium]MCA6385913.1 hypothetical protein [Cytophagales bacterium]